MRLSEIKFILEEVGQIDSMIAQKDAGNGNVVVSNIPRFKKFIDTLALLKTFDDDLSFLKSSLIYKSSIDKIIISYQLYESTLEVLKKVSTKSSDLLNAITLTLPKSSEENIIYIKLPPTNDFKEFIKSCEIFEKILNQIVLLPEIGGKLEISGVESGSNWLKICLGISTATTIIASIAWSSMVVLKKYQEVEYLSELVKTQHLKNENYIKTTNEFHEIIKQTLLEHETNHVYNEFFKTMDNEKFERVKFCIKELSEQMNKGAEVQPALSEPENVKNLFPDIKILKTIESKTKLLEK